MSYALQAKYPEQSVESWLCIFKFLGKKEANREKDKRATRFKGIEYRVIAAKATCQCKPCLERRVDNQ